MTNKENGQKNVNEREVRRQILINEIEKNKEIEGYSLKEVIAAARKIYRESVKKTKELEQKTGMKIDELALKYNDELIVKINPEEYDRLIEGYSHKGSPYYIPDKIDTIVRYDRYAIRKGEKIECLENNFDYPHTPKAKENDIKRIESYREDFDKYYEDMKKIYETTIINLPNTHLSIRLSRGNVSIYDNFSNENNIKTFGLFSKLEFSNFGIGDDNNKDDVPLLLNIKIPKENLPDFIKENIGEKISIFKSIKKDVTGAPIYNITDYSPVKEKLDEIVRLVRSKGEKTYEQSINKEER